MPKALSPSNEDYLEAIYDLSKDRAPVRSIDVSTRLGVSRASVNKAVGLLKDSGLLIQQPYGTITLTDEGYRIASRVRQCHTMLQIFLHCFLHVPIEVAKVEACKIEHAISDDTLERLTKFVRDSKDQFAPDEKSIV